MRTPFFTAENVGRSTNLADSQLINLFGELVETRNGKEVGAFYMTPGLDLLTTCGSGPIRGAQVMQGICWVVSGNAVYQVNSAFVATLVGTIGTSSGPVSIINNGNQLAIFDGVNGYLVPGGLPFTGGVITNGGSLYAPGDTIVLKNVNGTANATAVITVATVSGSAVATFTVLFTGAYVGTTSFVQSSTQLSTAGDGIGFTLGSATFGANVPVYTISLPFFGPVSATYQEGFGLVSEAGTQDFWQSNLFDLSLWDALNFSSADGQPDNIVALADLQLQVFVFKQYNTEVWINAGLNGFAFQRLQGVFIDFGCAAVASVTLAGDGLFFLAQNEQGEAMVMLVLGLAPSRVSTHSIEREIASYSTISDAIGYSYMQEGHLFYVLTFPTGNATWVYDVTASREAGVPMWHRRAALLNGSLNRHWGNAFAFFQGKPIIGDYLTGNLYAFNLDTNLDNGTQRKWLRTWRALPKPSDQPQRFSGLIIDMETGFAPAGTNPQVVLRWSDDGGHTWSNERYWGAGRTGATAHRVKFLRLGSTKRNTGLDRIFELSSTDPFTVGLIGAELFA